MTNIRRYFEPSQICFLTHVTHNRAPILTDNADLLLGAINRFVKDQLIAWAILPDHCHLLLNTGGNDVSNQMKRLKLSFSTTYRKQIGVRRSRVWQYRYWDHIVRNERDMQICFDYIHFNPVRHGLVGSPFEWEHSSAQEYFHIGHYADDWVMSEQKNMKMVFGE